MIIAYITLAEFSEERGIKFMGFISLACIFMPIPGFRGALIKQPSFGNLWPKLLVDCI